jgi:protein-disulfide isomerase
MPAAERPLSIEEQIARFEAANAARRTGPVQVFAFSDYECPSCARVHEQIRELTVRPGVTIVRRHFPLDAACNPAVKRQVHEASCSLARVAICAEAQGRLADMEDALFANQREHVALETLTARVGLDMERLRSCLVSPETDRRLTADVSEGIRYGIQATPSFVVDGRVFAGRLPPELLPLTGGAPGGMHIH